MGEPPAHRFMPTMGNRCAMADCRRTREQHDPDAPPAQTWKPMAEKECIVDHDSLVTRQYPSPEGLTWAHCRTCGVQLEAPANRRIG